MTQIGVPTNYRDPVLHKDLVGCLRYQASGACAVESMEGSSGFNNQTTPIQNCSISMSARSCYLQETTLLIRAHSVISDVEMLAQSNAIFPVETAPKGNASRSRPTKFAFLSDQDLHSSPSYDHACN